MAADEIVYRVTEGFAIDKDGRSYVMKPGDLVDARHPAYKGREHLFEPVDTAHVRDALSRTRTSASASDALEIATAGPGEKRTRTPAKPSV